MLMSYGRYYAITTSAKHMEKRCYCARIYIVDVLVGDSSFSYSSIIGVTFPP
jgi:hypothetical protein